jgi:hypothetical protein
MAFSGKALQRVPGPSQMGRKTARRIRKPFSPKVLSASPIMKML